LKLSAPKAVKALYYYSKTIKFLAVTFLKALKILERRKNK